MAVPSEPVVFNKWTSCITGPDDEIGQICFRADMSPLARAYVQRGLVAYLVTGVSLSALEDDFDALLAANYRLPETPLQR